MRVLVTGVTGQVGRALIGPLAKYASVQTTARGDLDLARPGEIASALDRIRPDLIVNAAAYTAVDRAEDEKDLAYVVNADAPGAVARWTAGQGIPLVHLSTDYVFDGTGGRPWREDDRPHPLSIYGASKLAGEEAIRAANGPHLIVRTEWVYAASGKNFLRTIARLASERKELRIVDDQYGAPTSARLIADIVAQLLRPGTTHLTSVSPPRVGYSTSPHPGRQLGTVLQWRSLKASKHAALTLRSTALYRFRAMTIQPKPSAQRTADWI